MNELEYLRFCTKLSSISFDASLILSDLAYDMEGRNYSDIILSLALRLSLDGILEKCMPAFDCYLENWIEE